MSSKIEELTNKLYEEGVKKGQSEADQILKDAEAKRSEILKKAEAEAEAIISNAKKKAEEIDSNTKSELKMFASQTKESLKTAIVNQIAGEVVSSNVKAALVDSSFIKDFILRLVQQWKAGEQLVVSSSMASELNAYFESNAKDLLDKGLVIKEVNGKQSSFTISPKDGSYKIEFGEEQFEALFKSFLRPRLVEFLF